MKPVFTNVLLGTNMELLCLQLGSKFWVSTQFTQVTLYIYMYFNIAQVSQAIFAQLNGSLLLAGKFTCRHSQAMAVS